MGQIISLMFIATLLFLLFAGGKHFVTAAEANTNATAVEDSRNESMVKNSSSSGTVKIILLYDSYSPLSVHVYPQILDVVHYLGNYTDVQTYPYGKAQMNNDSGTITVTCQHGEEECYGNKLHACAIDLLKDVDKYVDFIDCLLPEASNDAAADKCGNLKSVNSEALKACAKGARGQELLIHYGIESHKFNYSHVPYVLVNGQETSVYATWDLWDAVCALFEAPPKECNKDSYKDIGHVANFELPHFDTAAGADINVTSLRYRRNDNTVKKTKITFLYECLCRYSVQVYQQLRKVVQKLGNYIDLQTYPYGNAHAQQSDDNGKITVECQHGEEECYGNKLHACAIDLLMNVSKYVDFNACLLLSFSHDAAADTCGNLMNVDSEAIKTCAKGEKGQELLIYYGGESRKINYNYVPYVLINGHVKPDYKSLWDAVCESFDKPPMECNK